MKKISSLLFPLFLIFATAGFAYSQSVKPSKSKTSVNTKAKIPPIRKKNRNPVKQEEVVGGEPLSVTNLEISQTEIFLNCSDSEAACKDKKIIKVRASAAESEPEYAKYVYTVSAGRIIGDGANVEWDLSGVSPGSYRITAGIAQPGLGGIGWTVYGMTKTKILIVKE